jgi:hypothetical protein
LSFRKSLKNDLSKNGASENLKGGRGVNSTPRRRVTPGNPPCSRRMLCAAAYLRAAQAYMLISMPTGTSTIFGAFQAILALLKVKPDELRPGDKVIRNENFASGIFPRGWGHQRNAAMHNAFPTPSPVPVKTMTHQ